MEGHCQRKCQQVTTSKTIRHYCSRLAETSPPLAFKNAVESEITHIDYGHIEHFKPKGTPAYYEFAVEWNNLLLACGRCNGAENKGAKSPLANKGGPPY